MRSKKEPREESFSAFLTSVEEMVGNHWPDSLLKISDCDGNSAATCIVHPDTPSETMSTLVRVLKECPGINVDDGRRSTPSVATCDFPSGTQLSLLNKSTANDKNDGNSLFFDSLRFQMDLRGVSEESDQSRVPFAVLLIASDSKDASNDGCETNRLVAKKIFQEFDPGYSLYLYGSPTYQRDSYANPDILAVIMASTGLKKARQVAEKLRRCMAIKDDQYADLKTTLSIGVGASSFGSKIAQDDFMAQIEESLYAASQMGNSVRWNVGGCRETCQVTAEERRQLFSW